MNWLAHLHLSEPCIHFQLGNLLADIMKSEAWSGIHPNTRRGFKQHIAIDAFTDTHPIFKRSLSRLGPSGHLRGVAIDLAYDHFLSKHWNRFSPNELEPFLSEFYEAALPSTRYYPTKAKTFIRAIIKSNRLGSYSNLTGIRDAMERIDDRLSDRVKRRESTSDYFQKLDKTYGRIEADFLEFFPLLQRHIAMLPQ